MKSTATDLPGGAVPTTSPADARRSAADPTAAPPPDRPAEERTGAAPAPAGSAGRDDAALQALEELVGALDTCVADLVRARARAQQLLVERRAGRPWLEVVTAVDRPLVVEQVSTVMSTLATVGGAWRREQAHALRAEHVSISRIATLFGVTRQRISALLRDRDG